MANLVCVLGPTGSGKSTSIKGLDPKETVIISVLNKKLPFKGSAKAYSRQNKNLFVMSQYDSIIQMMESISKNAPNIRNIVIDDSIYIMRTEFFDKVNEKGYDKYNALADHFRRIIAKGTSLRDTLNVFLMLHTDTEESDGSIVRYKAATVGKLLDKMYNPLESVTVTLVALPKYAQDGTPEYGFYTNRCKVDGIEIPAKSPEGMFPELFMPNDLGLVVKAMNGYYNE